MWAALYVRTWSYPLLGPASRTSRATTAGDPANVIDKFWRSPELKRHF